MIRPTQKEDFEGVFKLIRELEEEEVFDKSSLEKIFDHLLESRNHFIYVFKDEDTVLAYMVLRIEEELHHTAKVMEIVELCVDQSVRSKGIGHLLILKAKKCAFKNEAVSLELTTNQKRKSAHRFYEREGFINSHYKYTMGIKGGEKSGEY